MTVEWLTVEGLEALPVGSVVRSEDHDIARKDTDGTWSLLGIWPSMSRPSPARSKSLMWLIGPDSHRDRWQVIYTPPVTEVVWDTTVDPSGDIKPDKHRLHRLRHNDREALAAIPAGTPVRVTVTVIDEDR